ncbi:MAG TPA: biotin--[acetyl-CoA-carboxylase] ligase, partial [Gemmatimonadaceae bacterium]|nr:biotin--[acetyl-CoA-carboxylase] ligase [Gemmatimonadaceae bacterium]
MAADPAARYEGVSAAELAARLGAPRVDVYESVTSTMDLAHAAAEAGAPAGTLIVADRQTAGRGRHGRRWTAAPGAGVWLTVVERPANAAALDVLTLRLGLHAARVLDPYLDAPAQLKWPNDVYASGGKLAGILVEARWQDERPAWVAIGIGINVRLPVDVPGAAAVRAGTSRLDLLTALVPGVRAATTADRMLGDVEMSDYASRDVAFGRPCREPVVGTVVGISPSGELLVRSGGVVGAYRSGS